MRCGCVSYSSIMACLRHSISMRLEVDGEEVVVEDPSHAMKTRVLDPINLRARRQPQALNRHARRAIVFVTCQAAIAATF